MYSAHSDDILPFLHLFQVLADGHNVFPSDIPKRQWKVISEGKSWATAQPLEKKRLECKNTVTRPSWGE